MANKVYIDTGIETSNIEAGVDKIVKELDRVTDANRDVQKAAEDTAEAVEEEGDAAVDAGEGMDELEHKKKKVLKVNVQVREVTKEVTREIDKETEAVETEAEATTSWKDKIKEVVKHLKDMITNSKLFHKSNKSFDISFGKVLKYTLGIKSLSATINKMKSMIKESFTMLRTYDKETDNAFKEIESSFNLFKQQLAPAFKDFLITIQPYISAFLEMITDATIKLTEFFAALSGKTTYLVAKGQNEEIAESLDEVAESAKKANRQLAAYDNLLVIQKQTDSASSSGSSSSKSGTTYDYETREVSNDMKEFADKLLDFGQKVKDVGAWCLENKGLVLGFLGVFVGAKALAYLVGIGAITGAIGLMGDAILVAGAAFGGFTIGNKLWELITGEKVDMSVWEQMQAIWESFNDGSWKEALRLWSEDISENCKAIVTDLANAFNNVDKINDFFHVNGDGTYTIIPIPTRGSNLPTPTTLDQDIAAFNPFTNATSSTNTRINKTASDYMDKYSNLFNGNIVVSIDGREVATAIKSTTNKLTAIGVQ